MPSRKAEEVRFAQHSDVFSIGLGISRHSAFCYDALEVNDSAVKVLGEPTLKTIARELVSHVPKGVTID
jgi:hypothetical protein